MSTDDQRWCWKIASDAREVHELLVASDTHHATASAPAPMRDPATTARHVEAHVVHGLRYGGELVAMFTLTDIPPRGLDSSVFTPALRPAYLQRLAVRSDWLAKGELLGIRCVRRACEVARARAADALRAEVNPDIESTHAMLLACGFQQIGPAIAVDGRRKAFLERRFAAR